MNIDWSNNIELDQRIQLERELAPWLWLMPTWCAKLSIWVSEDLNPNVMAQSECNLDYRWATLTISTAWFNRKELDRGVALVHELLHFFMNPLYFYAKDEIDRSDNELYKSVAMERLEGLNEQQVQDLAYVLYQRQFGV